VTRQICKPLQTACREYEASLLVDVAHDVGAVGPGGTASLRLQCVFGKVELVIGSFSKVFASNGGFVFTSSAAIREYLRPYAPSHTFSNAISPPQCAAVLKALEIVRSVEGEVLRQKLLGVAEVLRQALTAAGVKSLGKPGPIVPVLLGPEGWAGLQRPCVSTVVYLRIWLNSRPCQLERLGSGCNSWRHTRPRTRTWPLKSLDGHIGLPTNSLPVPQVREPPSNNKNERTRFLFHLTRKPQLGNRGNYGWQSLLSFANLISKVESTIFYWFREGAIHLR